MIILSFLITSHNTAIATPTITTPTITTPPLPATRPAADRCAPVPSELVGVAPTPPPEALAAVSNPDESAAPKPVTDAIGMVLVPITTSELPSDMAVPETVMAALPWNASLPLMARPRG